MPKHLKLTGIKPIQRMFLDEFNVKNNAWQGDDVFQLCRSQSWYRCDRELIRYELHGCLDTTCSNFNFVSYFSFPIYILYFYGQYI